MHTGLSYPTMLLRPYLIFCAIMIALFSHSAEAAAAKEEEADDDDIISLTAYNVKADRIEDFGVRIRPSVYPDASRQPKNVAFLFSKFAPEVTSVLPNTAAAKAGLRPGDRILKSEGQSTIGGPLSTGKFGRWRKTQDQKWKEVTAGKPNVGWTLEVEDPATKAVRTVKLVVPTPSPHWGSSTWAPPEGRKPSVVAEAGPLAAFSRDVLDNGIWMLGDWVLMALDEKAPAGREPPHTGYEWQIGNRREGLHRVVVTQLRGRTHVFFETFSHATGQRNYLTSPAGVLLKAWWSGAKSKTGEISIEEARVGFEHELDLWTNKMGKVSARWPFEVRPGYDPNAIFATLPAKNGVVAAGAPSLPAEFLKLPSATETQREMFAGAIGKLGAANEAWAYTETSRGIEDRRLIVMRFDPSKPESERSTLVSVDGKPPTSVQLQQWRDDGGDVQKALGDIPPLATVVDMRHVRVFKEEADTVTFELPMRDGTGDFSPDKFQALFRVNKPHGSFEEITVKLRGALSAGVAKVTEAGFEMRFQRMGSESSSQLVWLKAGGGARVLLVKLSRSLEVTRSDFRRVIPAAEVSPLR